MKRADIIASARKTLGTPWVHQGRVPGLAIDCVGVVLFVCRDLGISDYEPPPYDKTALWEEFLPQFRQQLQEIDIKQAGPADVLCFRQDKYPCHCGILTGDLHGEPRFIHSYALRRKVVEEWYTRDWRVLTRAAFRFPGLED